MIVKVQAEDFDLGTEVAALSAGRVDIGAVVSFSGLVRSDGSLLDMTLEHYPGMTERALETIATDAETRFSLQGTVIVHRYGVLTPGAQIMMVAAAARHRQAAFDGANFMMDYLKSRAPFWKSERTVDGSTWVDAREADDTARERWR